ncbi:hypothetical protein WJX74_004566 [Apatococcus lobatus]|uniref:Uncharacterized protein n=1 Tax=Apatococcus lobatus TaxID=904363 RepID=A0AAW1RZM4_9CHLO
MDSFVAEEITSPLGKYCLMRTHLNQIESRSQTSATHRQASLPLHNSCDASSPPDLIEAELRRHNFRENVPHLTHSGQQQSMLLSSRCYVQPVDRPASGQPTNGKAQPRNS